MFSDNFTRQPLSNARADCWTGSNWDLPGMARRSRPARWFQIPGALKRRVAALCGRLLFRRSRDEVLLWPALVRGATFPTPGPFPPTFLSVLEPGLAHTAGKRPPRI